MRIRDESSLVLLALGALLLLGGSKGRRVIPRTNVNPATGKPIVTAGTHRLSRDELQALAIRHGIVDVGQAVDIAMRESGGYSDVTVDTRGMSPEQLRAYWDAPTLPELSVGLWQVNVYDPANFKMVAGLLAMASPEGTAPTTPDDAVALLKGNAELQAVILAKQSNGGTSWAAWKKAK